MLVKKITVAVNPCQLFDLCRAFLQRLTVNIYSWVKQASLHPHLVHYMTVKL